MGVPRVWVSDTATHFKNRVIAQLSDALKVDHRFAVAYSDTEGVPRWKSSCPDRLAEATVFLLIRFEQNCNTYTIYIRLRVGSYPYF